MAHNEDTATNATSAPVAIDSPKLYYIKDARANSVPQTLTANQDLMTAFHLLPLYNQYVKQRTETNEPVLPIEPTYFPYINDLPGKNVIRPGNYIRNMLEAPEKGYGPIHSFSQSTLKDGFNLRPGPVSGFDPSVLGTEEDTAYKQTIRNAATAAATASASMMGSAMQQDALKANNNMQGVPQGYNPAHLTTSSTESPAHSSGHHHSHHRSSHHHSSSKSSTSSPHVDRGDRPDDGSREHRHKKKKKKRKHEHDHDHSHHEGEGDSEHRKKKKRKKEREDQGDIVVD